MRGTGAACTIARVPEPDRVVVTLELQPGGPISGRIRHASGAVEPFAGWLELSSRLEHVRNSARPADGDSGELDDDRGTSRPGDMSCSDACG